MLWPHSLYKRGVTVEKQKRLKAVRLDKKYYPYWITAPALIIFTVFYVGSIVGGFVFSFTNWSIYNFENPKFVLFENFIMLFTSESFYRALTNVTIFAIVTTVLKVGIALGLALLLNIEFRGRNLFRGISFLPCTLGALVVGYVFKFIFLPDGVLNQFLSHAGVAPNWLGDPKIALYTVCLVESWMWIGFNVAILLAGLQAIPSEMVEAAKIDGADGWTVFKNITIPFIRPSINVTITLCVIGGFNIFDIVMSMTNGGPNGATQVLTKLSYDALRVGTLGYASCINLVQFLIIVCIVTPLLKVLRRREIEI